MRDAPYLHERWEDEVALEQDMLALGSERMRARIKKAREKKDLGNLRPHRSLVTEWVVPLSEALAEWLQTKRRGVVPIAKPLLLLVPTDTAALVTLRTVVRMLGIERRAILPMAFEIGTWVEHEARALAWQKQDKESWGEMQAIYKRRGSNAAHQKRSRISIFGKKIAEGSVDWTPWGNEERRRVGLTMLDLVCKATGRFRVIGDPDWRPRGKKFDRRAMVLDPDKELLEWLAGAMDDEEVFWPAFMPTVIPPKPWEGPRDGGYWTPFVRTPFLIRFKASHEDQRQKAIDDYDALDMPEVYAALNAVQETPWRINPRIYAIAKEVWDKDLALAKFPRREEEPVPPRPPEAEHDPEEYRKWAKAAGAINTRNAKRVSTWFATRRTIVAAEKFLDEERFYFPHMLDFRGRMYPIPTDLQPQGEDLQRGLLTFADGKPVDKVSAGWLAVQLANTMGQDKVGFDERIAWVEKRAAQWLAIDEDPLGHREWLDTKDAWQALAAVFEWCRWLREGEGMVSALPIRVDGTCNGIQHLSAMIRDEVGGASVNLIPSDHPRDIYAEVAEVLTAELRTRDSQYAYSWLHATDDTVPRSLTKRPVMILPYGGTRHAYFSYVMDWLKENDEGGVKMPEDERVEATKYLVPLLWDAVGKEVQKAQEVMDWLKACAKAAAKTGLPLYWTTPSGFVVRHFYGQREERRVRTYIDGQTLLLRSWEVSPTLDPDAQIKGIAPNFVHSLDASALTTSVNLAVDSGVTSLTTIHDAYGTVAADMWTLAACLREAFVVTHTEEVLKGFLAACLDVAPEVTNWPEMPAYGTLDLGAVRESDYFFA